MLICLHNTGNKGKTSTVKNVIEQVDKNNYSLIYAFNQWTDQEITTFENLLQQEDDVFVLLQNKKTNKYLCLVTGGDEQETISCWWKRLLDFFEDNKGVILASQFSLICTVKDYDNGSRGVCEVLQNKIYAEDIFKDEHIYWVKPPYIFNTQRFEEHKLLMDVLYKDFAILLLNLAENS